MKKRDLKARAADLLRNDLAPGEEKELINSLMAEGMTAEEIESMRNLSSDIENAFDSDPSGRMDDAFYAMLEYEKRAGEHEAGPGPFLKNRHAWILAAAGIALFILGWFSASRFGYPLHKDQLTGLTEEVRDLKETLVLTMLDQNSAAERIKAVNMIKEIDTPNSMIIENLLRVLNSDENDNVRLLALESLMKYSDYKEVREGLLSSISKQTSPMLQLRITEIMTALNEKRAVPELRKLLDDAGLNYSVRTRIQEAVGTLL